MLPHKIFCAKGCHAAGPAVSAREFRSGILAGSTSYYGMDEPNRRIAVGHTFLGRAHWRTGANREAKLLLLTQAFDELGCERVELHTDIRNVRSQRAIEGLGATREAVLRRHRRRPDGSWRDTLLYAILAAEWPACP